MSHNEPSYNSSEIRELLNTVFDDPQLDAFCHDYFPDLFDQFGRGLRKDEKLTQLLSHCRRLERFDDLFRAMYACKQSKFRIFLQAKGLKIDTTSPNTIQIDNVPTSPSHTNRLQLESPYGTMPPDSPFYIERQADSDCWVGALEPRASRYDFCAGSATSGQVVTNATYGLPSQRRTWYRDGVY